MSDPSVVLRRGLPVLLWAGLIFWASTDALSVPHTSRFLKPFLLWIDPRLGAETVASVQVAIRKAGHMCEYAVLAVLVWRASNGADLGRVRPWPAGLAWTAWGTGVAYPGRGEFQQTFVPSPEGSPREVARYAPGAGVGVGGGWGVGRLDPGPRVRGGARVPSSLRAES